MRCIQDPWCRHIKKKNERKGTQPEVKHCSTYLFTRYDQDLQPNRRETYWVSPWPDAIERIINWATNRDEWIPYGRMTEDEMVRWHQWLEGHELEQAPEVCDGQGGLACCSPRGGKESDVPERLNRSNILLSEMMNHGLVPHWELRVTAHRGLTLCLLLAPWPHFFLDDTWTSQRPRSTKVWNEPCCTGSFWGTSQGACLSPPCMEVLLDLGCERLCNWVFRASLTLGVNDCATSW